MMDIPTLVNLDGRLDQRTRQPTQSMIANTIHHRWFILERIEIPRDDLVCTCYAHARTIDATGPVEGGSGLAENHLRIRLVDAITVDGHSMLAHRAVTGREQHHQWSGSIPAKDFIYQT